MGSSFLATILVITCNSDVQGGLLPTYPIAGIAGIGATVRFLYHPQWQNTEASREVVTSVRGKHLPILLPGEDVCPALCYLT